jgi:hypothetical protein
MLTKRLEQKPLGPDASGDREWLTQWIIEVPDITVPVCDELLKPILAGENQYRYSKELVAQELAGSMAYLIEHPPQSRDPEDQDDFAIYKAGVESALHAYEAIVKSGAKGGKWAPLEELLRKRQKGELDDYIRSATLKCMTGDTVTAGLHGAPSAGGVLACSARSRR